LEKRKFFLDSLEPGIVKGWTTYAHGVAGAFVEAGFKLTGWDGILASNVPIDAGLSSSASMELAVARAFASVSGFDWNKPHIAKICQRAENHWAGVNCGIMDQLIPVVHLAFLLWRLTFKPKEPLALPESRLGGHRGECPAIRGVIVCRRSARQCIARLSHKKGGCLIMSSSMRRLTFSIVFF
jgi:hypothetical protein